jgi:glycerol-3-phosphate cytidylyltransferase
MKKQIIGFASGTFDFFHAGHVAMMKEAKQHCDYLYVGLVSDPTISHPQTKNKPLQTMFERWLQVSSCKYVDEVIPINTEEEAVQIILTLQPDIRIVGEEYKNRDFLGKDLCKIHYSSRKHTFSSTELRKRRQIDL